LTFRHFPVPRNLNSDLKCDLWGVWDGQTMKIKGQVEKLMQQYQESEALHQVEALSHELLHMFVEMKELAAVEDKLVEKAVLNQVDFQAIHH